MVWYVLVKFENLYTATGLRRVSVGRSWSVCKKCSQFITSRAYYDQLIICKNYIDISIYSMTYMYDHFKIISENLFIMTIIYLSWYDYNTYTASKV